MKTDSNNLSRREALASSIKAIAAFTLGSPLILQAAPPLSSVQSAPEFVPENDYPFFGGELPEGYVGK